MKPTVFSIAQEMIDFQPTTLGKEIELIFQTVLDEKLSDKEFINSKYARNIEKTIAKHTGLNIKLIYESMVSTGIDLPVFHRNHIFFKENILIDSDFYKEDLQRLSDKFFTHLKNFNHRNYVDLKSATVHGIFTTLKTDLSINLTQVRYEYGPSAKHLTAVVLHEVGHLFTLFEFMNVSETNNQVLSYISKSITSSTVPSQKEFIFKEAEEVLNLSKGSLVTLKDEVDVNKINIVLVKNIYDNYLQKNNINIYDQTACEQLADQFVSRMGYGRELIDALSKGKSYYTDLFYDINVVTYIVTAPIALLAPAALALPTIPIIALWLAVFLLAPSAYNKDYSYDSLRVRMLRIKEDSIRRLKDKKLDKETTKIVLSNLEAMDNVLKNVHAHKSILESAMNFISSKAKRIAESTKLQRELEELASNPLFIKSAQLKVI